METLKWLVCIFEGKDLEDANKVFADNGFKVGLAAILVRLAAFIFTVRGPKYIAWARF